MRHHREKGEHPTALQGMGGYLPGAVLQTGIAYTLLGWFFPLPPPLPWLTVAVGSVCTLPRALPPPQHQPSLRSNASHRARLSSCHVTTQWPRASQRSWSGLQLTQITSENTGEKNKDQKTFLLHNFLQKILVFSFPARN